MRRPGVTMIALASLSAGIVGVAVGCGSDEPATIRSPDASASSGSSPSSRDDSGTSSSSSSSSGGGENVDAGDGGASTDRSNPNKISCGTTECDAGTGATAGICCSRQSGTRPACLTADIAGACNNTPAASTLLLRCDETADCPGPGRRTKCCLGTFGSVETSCEVSCRSTEPQLCKTDRECGDGGASQPTCAERTCRGFKMHVCGTHPDCD